MSSKNEQRAGWDGSEVAEHDEESTEERFREEITEAELRA